MKKLILLPLLFLLVFASCKDDDGEPAPDETLNELLRGTWVTANQEYKYYDENDQLMHEERNDTETVFNFDGSNYTTEGGISGTYTITKINGKDYINLTQGNQTEQIELTSISETGMLWTTEEDNAQYFDDGIKTADHAVVTFDFLKQ